MEPTKSTFTVEGDSYAVIVARMNEALSEVPTLAVEITRFPSQHDETTPSAPDPAALIGKSAELTLIRERSGASRIFAGVIVEATRAQDKDGRPSTRIVVMPPLFKLSRRSDCHVFQSKTVPDIVKAVLTAAGIPESDQTWSTKDTYKPRNYTTQYRETDLEFILRLLAEEGIFFAISFKDGKDKVLFTDDPTGFGLVEGLHEIPFAHTTGFDAAKECVLFVEERQEVRSDKVTVRDYDFLRPKFKMEASVEGKDPGPHGLEVYVYPSRLASRDADADKGQPDGNVGARIAQVLLDSIQSERNVVSGQASGMNLEPGYRFSITDHPYHPLNQEYLVTGVSVELRGERSFLAAAQSAGSDYICRFTAVPTKTTHYRPRRRQADRTVHGLQSAMTTGPSGQEIHTDEHGRVKAQFHWDRLGKHDDTASLWMRTSQIPTGGSMLLPRVGWEVGVRYVEGDSDRPVVMGRLYNAVTPPPYPLPANKARGSIQTATTPGGGTSNEFRMDDSSGKEEMFINASFDMSIEVANNETESIGNNEVHTIGVNHKLEISNSLTANIGSNQTVKVGGNRTEHVETFKVDDVTGNLTHNVSGNRDMKIGGDHRQSISGSSLVKVGANKIDLVVGSVTESAGGSMTHKVGAALVEMTAVDRNTTVAGNLSEATAALKAIVTKGGRGVEIGGSMTQKVAGAIITKIDGSRADQAGANFTEVAAGAQIIKCASATFEGETVVSFVMGASTITLTPASISIAGVSIKIDGATAETAAMILDN